MNTPHNITNLKTYLEMSWPYIIQYFIAFEVVFLYLLTKMSDAINYFHFYQLQKISYFSSYKFYYIDFLVGNYHLLNQSCIVTNTFDLD